MCCRRKFPAPLKPWSAIPGPHVGRSIAFGHWASLEGKRDAVKVFTRWIPAAAGRGELTCLRWEDKQYFVQPSNRQMDMGLVTKRSTPDRFMPDGATLIRPTSGYISGSRVGRIRRFAANSGTTALTTFQNLETIAAENSAHRHRETH